VNAPMSRIYTRSNQLPPSPRTRASKWAVEEQKMNEDSIDVSSSHGDESEYGGSGDEVYVPGHLKIRVPPRMGRTAYFNSNIQHISFKNDVAQLFFNLMARNGSRLLSWLTSDGKN
jgi:hypothetical protein